MYERIQKRTARRLYNEGKTIVAIASKMFPDAAHWNMATELKPEHNDTGEFDKLVNAYEFYNCNCETGYRCAFYIKN